MNEKNNNPLTRAIHGVVTQKDIFLWTFVLFIVGYILITLNTTNPSAFTNIYTPIFMFMFVLYIVGIVAISMLALRILPIAVIGLGDLKGKTFIPTVDNFWVFVGVGVILGLALTIGSVTKQSVMEVSVPSLSLTDKTQTSFVNSFLVPIIEESTTGMIMMPSLANMIAQGGLLVLFILVGAVGFFWFAGYNLLAAIGFLLLGLILHKYKIKWSILIVALAILGDGLFFTVLHTNVYKTDTQLPILVKTFVYRAVADSVIVMTGSIVPTIIAHSINNAVSTSYCASQAVGMNQVAGCTSATVGTWTTVPFLAFMPVVVLIALFYAIKKLDIKLI